MNKKRCCKDYLCIVNIWKVKLFNLSIDVIGKIDIICKYSQSGPQPGSLLKTLSKVQFSNQTYMAESEPACYDELIPELGTRVHFLIKVSMRRRQNKFPVTQWHVYGKDWRDGMKSDSNACQGRQYEILSLAGWLAIGYIHP